MKAPAATLDQISALALAMASPDSLFIARIVAAVAVPVGKRSLSTSMNCRRNGTAKNTPRKDTASAHNTSVGQANSWPKQLHRRDDVEQPGRAGHAAGGRAGGLRNVCLQHGQSPTDHRKERIAEHRRDDRAAERPADFQADVNIRASDNAAGDASGDYRPRGQLRFARCWRVLRVRIVCAGILLFHGCGGWPSCVADFAMCKFVVEGILVLVGGAG